MMSENIDFIRFGTPKKTRRFHLNLQIQEYTIELADKKGEKCQKRFY